MDDYSVSNYKGHFRVYESFKEILNMNFTVSKAIFQLGEK